MAIIEVQTKESNWFRHCDCSDHPATIKQMLEAALKSRPSIIKARALDAKTKQLLDMAIKV